MTTNDQVNKAKQTQEQEEAENIHEFNNRIILSCINRF